MKAGAWDRGAGACAGGGNDPQEEDSPQGAFLPHRMLFSSNPNHSDRVQGSSVALPDPGSSFQSWPQLPFPLLSGTQTGLSALPLYFLRDTGCCAKLLRPQTDKETFSLRPPAPTPLGLCVRDST